MSFSIQHNAAASRFEVVVDGQLCVLEYRLQGQVMTITHTGVPTEVGGRGIAADLATAAFEAARASGWKVLPACSYAAVFVKRHPEYDDLIVSA
ncbi:MAG TPA: GNAT family N-acetyltransferase [Arenimonas sp.]|uniref:GNAT family N-acetyltransferase n=1 Tax=Arenimonas sp. TaxID=1872635 RepID=UPI002BEA3ED3|nr:GNAT family N-acetyltransferase [Arenimonas sp.]HMB56524.1 GNAT family N-acetyltransferase [Arenimonas sp.]